MKITLILVFALLIRIAFLNFIPTGMTNDELHFILNTKAVYYNFTDIKGKWNPLSLTTIPGESSSELTFLLLAPIIGPLPTNLFTARLPFILLSIVTIYLLYLISKKLFNQKIALATALVCVVNPWSIYVGRTSFDAPLAVFFFILTLYLLLKLKHWWIMVTIIPSFLAFYTYVGTKILFLPFIIICSIFCYFYVNHRRYFPQYLILTLSCLFLIIFFLSGLKHQPSGGRLTELTNPNSQQIINLVDIQRNLTINTPLKSIFSNRYQLYLTKFSQKYINSFSPDVLFLRGDPTFYVSLWNHGYFYFIDFFLIVLGLCYLFLKSKPTFIFLISLILIAPIPEAIRSDTIPAYAFHSALQYPLLSILIGLGVLSISKKIIYAILLSLYLISFLNFINVYFFQYPLYQSEGFNFSRQVVSQYLMRLPKDTTAYILSHEPESLFRNYLFYSNNYKRTSYGSIKDQYQNQNRTEFTYNRLHFANKFPSLPNNQLLITDKEISPSSFGQISRLSINRLSDKVEIYSIFNDLLCHPPSPSVVPKYHFPDLNLPSLSSIQFCSKYISKL